METKKIGCFTWVLRSHNEDGEIWDLSFDDGLRNHVPAFCIKNYGGEPGPGFAGWKLVSGGPYDEAGSYHTAEDAMHGVAEWLRRKLAADVEVSLGAIRRRVFALDTLAKFLEDGKPS